MNAKERISYFRNWRDKAASDPSNYRIVKMQPEEGTFGIAKLMGGEWIVLSFLPPWEELRIEF